jgi:formylglycine-generating enzyme required for sulfatase activity
MPAPTTAALGLADLLRAWHALGVGPDDADREQEVASVFGWRLKARPPVAPLPPTDPAPQADAGPAAPARAPAGEPSENLLPPLRAPMWAVTDMEPVDAPAPPPPGPDADRPLTAADCKPMRAGRRPAPPPLVPLPRLEPALRRSLGRRVPTGLDLPRLLHRLSSGLAPPPRLPQQQRLRQALPLVVVWDVGDSMQPYQHDMAAVLQRLRRSGPLRLVAVRDMPGQHEETLRLHADGRVQVEPAATAGTPWQPPEPGARLLVLSHLGRLGHSAAVQAQWTALLRSWQGAGCPAVAWVPHGPQGVSAAQARHAAVHCLVSSGWAGASASASAANPLALQRQRGGTVADVAAALNPANERLRETVSLCAQLRPDLLRRLRLLDPALRAEPGLEALYWGDTRFVSTAHGHRQLNADAAAQYRPRFNRTQHPRRPAALQARIRSTTAAAHAWEGRSIAATETLLFAQHASAEAQALADADASLSGDRLDWARGWFKRVVPTARAVKGDPVAAADLASFSLDLLAWQGADAGLLSRFETELAPLVVLGGSRKPVLGVGAAAFLHARQRLQRSVPSSVPLQLLQQGQALAVLRAAANEAVPGTRVLTLDAAHGVGVSDPSTAPGPARMQWHDAPPQGQPAQPIATLTPRPGLPEARKLHTASARYTLQTVTRPAWAREFGRDEFGLYADLAVHDEVQRMRWIEPGEFWMGSPYDEPGRHTDEGPRHRVAITCGYWLADTACSQAFWRAVMGLSHNTRFKGDALPVERVSWDEVQGFLRRVPVQGGEWWARLPTEAQWEYACRAGTLTAYSVGSQITPDDANFGTDKTLPVKALPANRWGLYQMHGNVWEWCEDTQRRYGAGPERDPEGPAPSGPRVLRGGGWILIARGLRSAKRDTGDPGFRNDYIGFRLSLRSTSPGEAEPRGRGAPPPVREERVRDAPAPAPKKRPRRQG